MASGKNGTKVQRHKGVCGVDKKSASTSLNTIMVETPRLSFTLSILLFFFIFMFGSGITNVILAQETSEEVGLDDTLSSFDEEDFAESDAEVLSGFDYESGIEVMTYFLAIIQLIGLMLAWRLNTSFSRKWLLLIPAIAILGLIGGGDILDGFPPTLLVLLGLGTFIGKTLLERMKASVNFDKCPKTKGAMVTIQWQTRDLLAI